MKTRKMCVFRLPAILLVVAMVMAGCSANQAIKVEPPPAPVVTPKGDVSCHVWDALLSYGAEQKEYSGYATYTYLLFNSNEADATTPEGKRYDALLRAVLLYVNNPKNINTAAGYPKDETNIFCIPFRNSYVDKDNALKKYDFDNAQKYLAVLKRSVKNNPELFDRLKYRTGPFLISLCEPLPRLQGRAATSLLYLDLTGMPADGMGEVLDPYMRRLDAGPLMNMEKLREPLKLILLPYILHLHANLKIVKVVMEDF